MLGFRLNPFRPFLLEDAAYFVLDEGRRLPGRIKNAAIGAKNTATHITDLAIAKWHDTSAANRFPLWLGKVRPVEIPQPNAKVTYTEAELLDEPQSWKLATEPLAAVATGTESAVTLHAAAAEQLDALTYVLDRMRDELRPLMTYARLDHNPVIDLHSPAADLETSIEALLELSRQNSATRPKGRVRTAA